jgi:hypothetical protein
MRDDATDTGTPTRREYVKYGGTVLTAGLLAGCTGDAERGGTPTETDTATANRSYSVSMSPMGEVTFESPPETVFTRLTHLADMAFALGRGDTVNAMHAPDYYSRLWNQFVERLPGVSLDWTELYSSWEPRREKLYELDSDIHLSDPAWIAKQGKWDRPHFEEIATNVSPWFGNSLSDRHAEPTSGWADYEYYTL